MQSKYKRVLIKLSGEALSNENDMFDPKKIENVAQAFKKIVNAGAQVGIVVGGGNIFRGRSAPNYIAKTDADHIGMLATVMNAIMLKAEFDRVGVRCCVMSAIDMYQICEQFSQRDALRRLEENEIVIFACGTGRPYFSTDTAAVLRALETNCDVLLCAKNIDGVYSADPKIDKTAIRYDKLSYHEVISKNLQALDQSAFALCRDFRLPILVFEMNHDNLVNAVCGKVVGTYIS